MTPLRQICFQALTMLLPVEVSTRALKEPGRIEDISRYVGYSKYLKRTAWIHVYLCHSGLEKGSGCLAVEAYGAHALQGVSIQVFGVHRISKAPTASQMNHQEVWSHWQTGLRWFQSKFLWLHPHATCKLIDVTTETLLPLISFRFYSMLYSNFVKAPPPTA